MPKSARWICSFLSLVVGLGIALVVKGAMWRTGSGLGIPLILKAVLLFVLAFVGYWFVDKWMFAQWQKAWSNSENNIKPS